MMLKYLLVLAVVFVALQIWRARRRTPRTPSPPRAAAPLPPPQDMVACAHCGLHLPRTDALAGPGAQAYCCAEHQRQGPA